MVDENRDEFNDSLLDRAMEAAFAPAPGNEASANGNGISVLQRIERRHGAQTRIALRDAEEDNHETLVLPSAKAGAVESGPAGARYQVHGELAPIASISNVSLNSSFSDGLIKKTEPTIAKNANPKIVTYVFRFINSLCVFKFVTKSFR